ncbi:MAG TPA: glycosyltransferase family 2 protein [Verrucomicrobiae bacterium]|nr:glycosyltransferase family 2 protein [Verrucomicrobiae bacterium]
MEAGLFTFVSWFSWVILVFVIAKILFFTTLSMKHHTRHKRLHPRALSYTPFVSVIVPSYNEGMTLNNCIESLVAQTYPNFEIVIVNDGSTDDTLQVARRIARQYKPLIRIVTKENGGKATALNRGIARSRGDIIVCIDADSIFLPNTVEQLVLSFHDKDVAAVGGNVKVANNKKLLSRQQSLEYITGLTIQRKAFAHLGCMQVISGAIGAFRREAILGIGGYSTTTIVEDMDTTIELARHHYKVVYNPSAIAYTEAPETLDAFLKQRHRWIYGSFQVLSKHRSTLWKRNTNFMGFIGMPYFLLSPWLDMGITILFVLSLFRAIVTNDLLGFLGMVVVMFSLQVSLIMYALVADKENKKLIALAVIDSFIYYHLISYATLRAGIEYLRGNNATWNKLERYGKNVLPQETQPQQLTPATSAEKVG